MTDIQRFESFLKLALIQVVLKLQQTVFFYNIFFIFIFFFLHFHPPLYRTSGNSNDTSLPVSFLYTAENVSIYKIKKNHCLYIVILSQIFFSHINEEKDSDRETPKFLQWLHRWCYQWILGLYAIQHTPPYHAITKTRF